MTGPLLAAGLVAGMAGLYLFNRRAPHAINGWYAGPIVHKLIFYRKNYSRKIDLAALSGGVLQCQIPADGELDALCKPIDKLPNGLKITYDLVGTVRPSENTAADPLISICFQRKGDNWSGEGNYQHYRWYAQAANVLRDGAGSLTVDFNSTEWSDVMGMAALNARDAFAEAKANAGALYITFGFSAGRSHGVVGDARFSLIAAEEI